MNYEDLEERVTKLENKSWRWYDVAAIVAAGLVILGVIDLVEKYWNNIVGFIVFLWNLIVAR